MKKLTIFIVLAFMLVLCAAPVYANGIPDLPHAFKGTVTINGSPAPVGTQISATVAEGEVLTTSQNPVGTVNGNYGIDGLHLLVQGYGLSGAITFYVNGVEAEGQTAIFEAGGGPTERNLTVTIIPPTIGYSPSSFSFTANEGGANPASQTLSISNTGVNPTAMDWAVTDDATWLSLSPTSGSSSGEVDSVTLSVDISGMSAGNYSATITISGTGATNTPRTAAVSLAISAPITGQVEVTVPAGQTDYVVDASAIADTTITVDTIGEVTITVKKYASNPHPGVALPATMIPRYIDIEVDNLDNIVWPMYVEQTYIDAEVAGLNEASLAMYYYKAGAWHRCSDTGVNTADNYIWAKMIKVELSGSPVAIGGAPPAPVGGGGGGGLWPSPAAPPPGTIDLSGFINVYGIFTASVIAESEDGLCYLTIEVGTKGLTIGKGPLSTITIVEVEEPPTLPEDAYIIGLAYDLGPNGATFSPAISLTINYDPASLPEGYTEQDLYIAYWDGSNWLALTTTVNAEANTAYCQVSHFTTFAVIAPAAPPLPAPAAFVTTDLSITPAEVEPNEAVTISVSVANTGDIEGSYTVVLMINDVTEAEESVTIAAGASQSVSFSVTKEDAGIYSVTIDDLSGTFVVTEVTPPPTPINWPLIGGIIAGVIVVGLLIFFVVRRRAY